MSEMGMAPLRPKVKVQDGKRVLRCGVRDCREVICKAQGKVFVIEPGYAATAKGIFIKTRRAANRLRHHKENAQKLLAPILEKALSEVEEEKGHHHEAYQQWLNNGEPKTAPADPINGWGEVRAFYIRPDFEEMEQAAVKDYKHGRQSREDPFGCTTLEGFPVLVECALCGRLSKITGAE